VYREIVRNERIVFTAILDDLPGHELVTTVTFADEGGKTKLTVRQTTPPGVPASARTRAGAKPSSARRPADRGDETWPQEVRAPRCRRSRDRATRVFDARELVWKVVDRPGAGREMVGPERLHHHDHKMEVKPGGRCGASSCTVRRA